VGISEGLQRRETLGTLLVEAGMASKVEDYSCDISTHVSVVVGTKLWYRNRPALSEQVDQSFAN
jgi:hypothetical protein